MKALGVDESLFGNTREIALEVGAADEARRAGHRVVSLVKDEHEPLVAGEVDRATAWGTRLAEAVGG